MTTVKDLKKILEEYKDTDEIRISIYNPVIGKNRIYYLDRAGNFKWQKMNNMFLLVRGLHDTAEVKNF